jgi:hypothetical protein
VVASLRKNKKDARIAAAEAALLHAGEREDERRPTIPPGEPAKRSSED